MSGSRPRAPGGQAMLNEYQARRLQVTCRYIDRLLGDVEAILNTAASKAAFPRYSDDLTPAQRRTIEDFIAHLRARLVRVLESQGISKERTPMPVSHVLRVTLGTIEIAIEELKPKYMRGYGEVHEAAAAELNRIVAELGGLVSKVQRYLAEEKQAGV